MFFSIKAVWGRHCQLDDSLVGQLTKDHGARIQFKPVHFGVFSTSRFTPPVLSSDWALTDSLEEVMIFGVSRRAPTDPLQEVMFFGVSGGSQLNLLS